MEEILNKKADNTDVCAVIFICRGDIVLLGLRTYPEGNIWTTPGGKCEIGETIGDGLYREVREEVGITDLIIHSFFGSVPGGRNPNRVVYIFSGTTEQNPLLIEPDKFIEWRWFSMDKIPNNFINQPMLKLFLEQRKNNL